MSVPSSETVSWDAQASSTLANYQKTWVDNVSKVNAFLYQLMKLDPRGYVTEQVEGLKMNMPLLYALGQADSYSGYDVLDVTPIDGFTMCQWEWAQASVPISISGKEEKLNRGKSRIFTLLQGKTTQAEMGIQEFFNYRALCGAGSTDITTAYTSPVNGSTFIDPLFKVIRYTVTDSVEVGGINGYTHSWWRNYATASSATTFAGFLKELNKLRRKCGRGPGGFPNLHLVDEDTAELYNQSLAKYHTNQSYKTADIPFDNVLFHGYPVVADEKMPDVASGSETQSESSGSWAMVNSKFFQFKVDTDTNFSPTPFVKPENQDAKVAHILWLGGFGCSNRRKQGVMGSIDTTISS